MKLIMDTVKYIKKVIIIMIFMVMSSVCSAQNIVGRVIDRDSIPLQYASVAILNAIDSSLVSYTSVDKNGGFSLTKIAEGNHIFQINMMGYEVYQKLVEYKGENLDLGIITLQDAEFILDGVTVTAIIPIVIKTDTIAFNTKAFKVRIDDSVEDLLKKLPGVEVDANGKVKAQGEDITKVYVDGKEFFSGDPAIAIKNLAANAIEKVEVIDERTDKEKVTGIKDAESSKVINLILKNESKVNDFGTFQTGYGSDNRHLSSLNYNRFTSKLQTSIIGKYNNVNSSGSDISQILSFGGDRGRFRASNGGISGGFVTTGVGGLNLGYNFKKNRDLNSDYFYNYTDNTSGDIFTKRTEFIGDETLYSESKMNNESTTKSNKVNFSYYDTSNELVSIRLRGSIGSANTIGRNISSFESYNSNNVKEVENVGFSSGTSDNNNGRVDLRYIRKLNNKSSRNIGVRIGGDFSKTDSKNNNNYSKTYTVPAKIDEVTVGKQASNTDDNNVSASIWYDEPLSDKHFLTFSTGMSNTSVEDYTNQSQTLNGENNSVSTFISDVFEKKKNFDTGLMYKYTVEKITVDAGAYFEQLNQSFGNRLEPNFAEFDKNYSSINPSIRVRWRPKKGNLLYVRVRNGLTPGTINQISPVVNNFDPLHIRKGNVELTPEKYSSIMTTYTAFDYTTGFNFYTSLFYSYSTNAIVDAEAIDLATRVRTISYLNLGDKDDFTASLNVAKRLENLEMRFTVGLSGSISNSQSVINAITNQTLSKNGSLTLGVENNIKDNVDFVAGVIFSKSVTEFSGAPINRDYFQQSYFVKTDWNITNSFNINSQFKYDVFTDNNFGTNQSVPIWNASVSYSFLKSKSLNLKLSALDVLNKSVGYERTSTTNSYQEITKQALGAYYMVSLTYLLNGDKKSKESSSESNE